MPGRFADGLVATEQACAGVTDPISADPWWAGSLDLGSDGRYRANLRLVRYCSAEGAALPVDSGHALVRLREGSWRVANAGRKLEFVETSGERLLVRLDALAAPQAGWAAICLDGALLFASLLEAASLNPALVILPNHALVAWQKSSGRDEWEYLETTLINSATFEQAVDLGRRKAEAFRKQAATGNPLNFRQRALRDLRTQALRYDCLLYTSPSPRDRTRSRMPSSA